MAEISFETRNLVLRHAASLREWMESRPKKNLDPLEVNCLVLKDLSDNLHQLIFRGTLPDTSKARALDGKPHPMENYLTNIAAVAMLALDRLKASETETAGD